MESEAEHRNPFEFMEISGNHLLNDLSGRSQCIKCNKSRKYFCYTCYLPTAEVAPFLPKVQLPLKIDIIKHPLEGDAKSTAIHAAILAPDDVSIYTYPNIPNYDDTPADSTILIFPSRNALHVNEIFDANRRTPCGSHVNPPQGSSETDRNDEQSPQHPRHYTLDNLPIKRAVFIDSTWEQSKGIYKDPRINKLRPLVLQYRLTQFWRHQKKSPRWFLATIEAIHQFLMEVHINAWGLNRSYLRALHSLEIQAQFVGEYLIDGGNALDLSASCTEPYNGQYDNLFFFFSHIHQLIHNYYDRIDSKSTRRPFQ